MTSNGNWPDLPAGQQSFTIGEASKLCKTHEHTLRYWEKCYGKFLKVKYINGRRYYSPENIHVIRRISQYGEQGLKAAGIRNALAGKSKVAAPVADFDPKRVRNELAAIAKILDP